MLTASSYCAASIEAFAVTIALSQTMALPTNSTAVPSVDEPTAPAIDNLFATGQTQHRPDATEAEIILGIAHREERIRFLEASKELVEWKEELEFELSEVEYVAEENEIDLNKKKDVCKLGLSELNTLLTQFYGKTLPPEIASSKKAKVEKWMELKDLDRSELNKRLPSPHPWDAVWDSTQEATLRQLILEKRALELSKSSLEKQRAKASTIANVAEASPGTLIDYAEALLLGRSKMTKDQVKPTLSSKEEE